MNKVMCLLFACCVFLAAATAGARDRIGPVGGVNLADLRIKNFKGGDAAMRGYYGAGFVVDIALSGRVAMVMSPMVVLKGAGIKSAGQIAKTSFILAT